MGSKCENRLETRTWSTPTGEPPPSLTVPGLTILGHPQIQRVGERAALLDLSSGREALLSRGEDRKSTRLNSSHANISYAVFCLKKKKRKIELNSVSCT